MAQFSLNVNVFGDGTLTVYGSKPYAVRTVKFYPDGYSIHSLDESNARAVLAWPEDGDTAKEAVYTALKEIIENSRQPLLTEAALSMMNKLTTMNQERRESHED